MSGLVKPFLAGPARHLLRLLGEPEYRALCRMEAALGRRPRFTPFRTRVLGWTLAGPDAASFLAVFDEIFVQRRYAFPWPGAPPRILDLGANLGLSVLFFKRLHPESRITAVEADPRVYEYLSRNLSGNRIAGVETLNRAAWTGPGRVAFLADGADGGRAVPPGTPGAAEVEGLDVPALLRAERFDVVKMDIEGGELEVLPACRGALGGVRYLAVEYHSPAGQPQRLTELIGAMEGEGFRVHLHSVIASPTPFLELRTHAGFDLQLNLYGWRA